MIFLAFGKILVLNVAFIYSNSNSKSIEKLIFLAVGKILVLDVVFSFSHSIFKKYWKIDFSSFWQDLGFECCFFLYKF